MFLPALDDAGGFLRIPLEEMPAQLLFGDIEELPQVGEVIHIDAPGLVHLFEQPGAQIGCELVVRRLNSRRRFPEGKTAFGAKVEGALDLDFLLDDGQRRLVRLSILRGERRQGIIGPALFEGAGVHGIAVIRNSDLGILF